MSDLLSLIASIAVLASSALVQPTRASCPRGWVISNGLDRAGRFVCRPERTGCEIEDWSRACTPYQPPGFIAGRIYCGPGFEPAQTRYGDGARCKRQPRM